MDGNATTRFGNAALLAVASTVAFVVLLPLVGMPVPAAVVILAWMRLFGESWRLSVLTTLLGVAALQLYEDEQLFARAAQLSDWFGEQLHALAGTRHVIDIRNIGMMGAIVRPIL